MAAPKPSPWPFPLRMAGRELRNNRGFALYFVANLILGLVGFLLLDAFRSSLEDYLDQRSKSILAADVAARARRPFTTAEEQILRRVLPPQSILRQEISTFSMVANQKGDSRLISLKGVDDRYPFYGQLTLEKGGAIGPGTPKSILTEAVAWVYPELLVQLDMKLGERIKIGDLWFTIADTIVDDPSASAMGTALAPRVLIGDQYLKDTGLIQKGSRIRYQTLAKIPPEADSDAVAKALLESFPATDIRVRSHRKASEELGRLLQYTSDYLGLVAMVALFLASVGGAYLFRSYLMKRTKDIAILLSVGVKPRQIQSIYICQLLLLSLTATLFSVGLAFALLPVIPHLFAEFLARDFVIGMTLPTIITGAAIAASSSLLVCLPVLERIGAIRPTVLFQEQSHPRLDLNLRSVAWYVPAVLAFWALSVIQSHSLMIGSLFVAVFLAAGLALAFLATWLLMLMRNPSRKLALVPRLALINLSRRPLPTVAAFLSIGLGSLLVNVIPQLRSVLLAELTTPAGMERPSLFMFDIQEEQVAPLQQIVAAEGIRLQQVSPLVRARLTAKNGEPWQKSTTDDPMTREREREERFRNRGMNLSFRAQLSPAETIVAGRDFGPDAVPANPSDPAEVSIEMRFADRLGIELGDILTFDVQGVEVAAKVINKRSVRWTSFLPNFFIQFPPGVLDYAPKTFIAATVPMEFDEKVALQNKIVADLPNISIVDVSRVIERISKIISQVTQAVSFMAFLSLGVGLTVLFSIAWHQAQQKKRDVTLLKVLGLSFGKLRAIVAYEYLFLGLLAATFGSGLGLGISVVMAYFFFDSTQGSAPGQALLTGFVIATLVFVTGLVAMASSLKTPAIRILNSDV